MFDTKNKFMVFVILLLVFMYIPAESLAIGKIKIGIVNLDRAGRESKRGKKIVGRMKAQISQEQEKIRKKEEKVKELRKELNKQGLIMSEELKRKKETDYRLEYRALERHIRDAREEIQIKQREATKKILNEIIEIIKEIGKKEGYTYIVTSEFIMYNDKAIDITDKVIREYNKKYRKTKN